MANKRKSDEEEQLNQEVKRVKKQRIFNINSHPKRKIAIQFFYLGWEHDGLVQQTNTDNTVEQHLMTALLKTRLISDWNTCEYSRCGRTDKGVSAFRQTAAFIVRSCCKNADNAFWDDSVDDETKKNYPENNEEMNYLKMLNSVLPTTIRIFSWAPVPRKFSARFDCNGRIYKYALPKADLNVERMRDAASRLIGEHNFSNFCQIDMNEKRLEQSYTRKIYKVEIEEISRDSNRPEFDMLEVTVTGSGFLWHMIRYIVSVLHEIGRGNEEPELVTQMLDLNMFPSRPQYYMASNTPLCLFDNKYDNCDIQWNTDETQLNIAIIAVQKQWAAFQARSRMMENMLGELTSMHPNLETTKGLHEFIQDRPISSNYAKFVDRPRCATLQAKRERLAEMKKATN
ncbi:unnamed protein product [Caenorhabditis bovis]|uniref:tRNA pseudouridine synthase n=1 Tax=Caenorhabditis bovis TaxID=2654633 RepID=A0A8S1EIR8_9PELO|nr:unnamed protein product [Caenorhabditis bovis]